MNYSDNLNKLINNIEENICNKIDYEVLARIIGTSSYTMQRIFCFLTNMTLTEYIRKRRLSLAAEELKKTDIKIIDLAVKYQYDSQVSFSNAFKKMHGIRPVQVKNNDKIKLKSFPKIEFNSVVNDAYELDYRIINLEDQVFFGKTTGKIKNTDKKSIRNLFEKSRNDGSLDYIIKNSDGNELYYGIYQEEYISNVFSKCEYYILGKNNRKDFVEMKIPKAIWGCFKVNSKEQKDILKTYQKVYSQWLPSSKFNRIYEIPELEIYYKDYCEICIPVK